MTLRYVVFAALALAAGSARAQFDAGNPPDAAAMRATYDRVMAHLDPGGGILLYLNTTDAVQRLLAHGEAFLEFLPEDDDSAAELKARIRAAMDFLIDAGINDITAVGMSSIPATDGLEHVKLFMGWKEGAPDRAIWRTLGGAPRAMQSHQFLPADAVLARTANFAPGEVWSLVMEGIGRVGGPEAAATVREALADVRDQADIDVEAIVKSLGEELMVSVLLDRNVTMSIPGPSGMLAIPRPGILLGIAARDDSLHELLSAQLRQMGMPLLEQTVDGHPWLTIQQPLPLPVPLQPTLARTDDFLLIASTPDVMRQAFAAARGENSLLEDADFQRLMAPMPTALNGMTYVSPRLNQTFTQLQLTAAQSEDPQAARALERLLLAAGDRSMGLVRINAPDGVAVSGRTTSSGGEWVAALAVAPAAVFAAIALPAYTRARTAGQVAGCQGQLQALQVIKQQWAMDHPDKPDTTSALDDLAPYFGGHLPTCPHGGAYTLGDLASPPTCSLHGSGAGWE